MRLPLSCLRLTPFCATSAKSPLFDELPIRVNSDVAGAGQHPLLERVVHHHRLAAGEHGHAGQVDAELEVHVEPVLLVVAALFGEVEVPRRAAARRIVDHDLLQP